MSEKDSPQPEDSYGIAKFAIEMELKNCYDMFGLNYIIFRPHNVYGERQNINDKYRNVIGIYMKQIMQGEPLTVFGDGEQERAFTYIFDITQIIAKSVFKKRAYQQTFNIGSDKPVTINKLTEYIGIAFGKKPIIRNVLARNEVKIAYSEHKKIKEIFGSVMETNLKDGIDKMAIWAKTAKLIKAKKFKNIEVKKNLPKIWEK